MSNFFKKIFYFDIMTIKFRGNSREENLSSFCQTYSSLIFLPDNLVFDLYVLCFFEKTAVYIQI